MTDLNPWAFEAQIEWVRLGPIMPLDWAVFPVLKASIVFADSDSHELFSTSGTATARIIPVDDEDSGSYNVEVLLPSRLARYVQQGTQFLVVRGSICVGIGIVTNADGQKVGH